MSKIIRTLVLLTILCLATHAKAESVTDEALREAIQESFYEDQAKTDPLTREAIQLARTEYDRGQRFKAATGCPFRLPEPTLNELIEENLQKLKAEQGAQTERFWRGTTDVLSWGVKAAFILYPEFRTIQGKLEVSAPNPLLTGLGAASVCRLTRHSPHLD